VRLAALNLEEISGVDLDGSGWILWIPGFGYVYLGLSYKMGSRRIHVSYIMRVSRLLKLVSVDVTS